MKISTNFKPIVLLFVAIIVGLSTPSHAESPDDIVVFVHTGVSTNHISVAELKQIYLKQKTSWSGGDNIVCINPPESAAVRKAFRSKVLGMTSVEEERYWSDQKIRRQLFPPPELANTPKAVFKLKNAIGYAYRKDVPAGVVKIVAVIP